MYLLRTLHLMGQKRSIIVNNFYYHGVFSFAARMTVRRDATARLRIAVAVFSLIGNPSILQAHYRACSKTDLYACTRILYIDSTTKQIELHHCNLLWQITMIITTIVTPFIHGINMIITNIAAGALLFVMALLLLPWR